MNKPTLSGKVSISSHKLVVAAVVLVVLAVVVVVVVEQLGENSDGHLEMRRSLRDKNEIKIVRSEISFFRLDWI